MIVLLAFVFAVYVPTLNDYFHGDDFLAFVDLTTRPALRQMEDVFTFNDSNVYWRPLGQVYYLAIYSAAGLDPYYFHLANLGVFIATLVLLYRFCIGFGLGRFAAFGAVAVFGLLPNHAISVAWVTNAPRLLAVLFALLCLVCLQEALRSGKLRWEVPAFLAMGLAVLSDEVAVALTPLPVLYGLLAQGRQLWRRHIARAFVYGALGLSVTLLQLTVGMDDHPAPVVVSLSEFGLGWHVPREYWALVSKLVLPVKDGVAVSSIAVVQWAAGAVALGLAALGLVIGTKRVWFLILWTALALLPFTLWSMPIAPARYEYMAAVPFAVLLSWSVAALLSSLARSRVIEILRRYGLTPVAYGIVAVALGACALLAARETADRNEVFAATAEPYRTLAVELPRALPSVPPRTRLVIYYGVWTGSFAWQDAVVQTIYKDRSLKTVNFNHARTESSAVPASPRDIVVFYTERGFILPPPR